MMTQNIWGPVEFTLHYFIKGGSTSSTEVEQYIGTETAVNCPLGIALMKCQVLLVSIWENPTPFFYPSSLTWTAEMQTHVHHRFCISKSLDSSFPQLIAPPLTLLRLVWSGSRRWNPPAALHWWRGVQRRTKSDWRRSPNPAQGRSGPGRRYYWSAGI